MKLFKQNDKLNIEEVNEVVSLTKRILHLFYIAMVIAMILIVTIIVREWGILQFLLNILSVLAPFFIGFVLAWLMNPIVTRMEKKKIPRALGTLIVYAVFLLVILLFIRFLIPLIYEQLQVLIGNLPSIFRELESFINGIFSKFGNIQGVDIDGIKNSILNTITASLNGFMTSAPSFIMNFAGGLFSSIVTICFGLVIGIYMLIDLIL